MNVALNPLTPAGPVPVPMERKEALARGLLTYPSRYHCRKCCTTERTTRTNKCVECARVAKETQKAKEAALAQRIRARVMKTALATARRQVAAEEARKRKAAAPVVLDDSPPWD